MAQISIFGWVEITNKSFLPALLVRDGAAYVPELQEEQLSAGGIRLVSEVLVHFDLQAASSCVQRARERALVAD